MKVLSAEDYQICILALINHKYNCINYEKECAISCKFLIVLVWLNSIEIILYSTE